MADTNLRIKIGLTGSAEVASGLKAIGGAASSLKTSLLAIGTALAGAAGLGALGAAAVATARLGGQLSDLSARTGISARSLIVLRQAFQDAGVGAEAVGGTINRLQRTIVEAASGGGAAADALAGLGISAQSIATLAPEDQFSQVAAAISSIADPAQRSAAAMAIFGKSGAELLPLFGDGGAIGNAQKALGQLPDVLGRNIGVLDSISDRIDRFGLKATQLFAGIFDELGPKVDSFLERLESIDLTRVGQNVGAYVNLFIKAFEEGNLGDFIGLTIQAGTEMGEKAFKDLSKKAVDFFTDQTVANAIGNFSVSLVAGVGKALIDIDSFFRGFWRGAADFVFTSLASAFTKAVNVFATAFETVLNATLNAFKNSQFGGKFLPDFDVKLPKAQEVKASFDESLGYGIKSAQQDAGLLKLSVDAIVAKYREFFGISVEKTAEDGKQLTALEQLALLIKKQREETERLNKSKDDGSKRNRNGEPPMDMAVTLKEREIDLTRKLDAINERKARVENSWLTTSAEKFAARKKLLEQEAEIIESEIASLDELSKKALPSEQLAIEQRMAKLQSRSGGIQTERMGMGPDPESFSENFSATLINLQNQFGTVAQQMAQTFADVFNAATASISGSIQGLIYGTMTWGAALANIGTGIIKSLIQSFADMVASWIMSHVIMKGVLTAWGAFKALFVAKDVAMANAGEAAKTPALTTNATLASISSWGIAVGVGLAAIAAVLAATGAFKEGGYTGDGDPNAVAGIVHRGEYVVPADAVDRIGVGTLEAMTSGGPATSPMFTSGAAPAPITLNMGVFDDPRRLSDWARSNEGRTVLIDILKQHAHEFTAS
jgi:hypothetical protein